MERSFEEIVSENGGHGMAAHHDFGTGGARFLEDNATCTLQTAGGQALAQGKRERVEMG
jgi:hypothetical protein